MSSFRRKHARLYSIFLPTLPLPFEGVDPKGHRLFTWFTDSDTKSLSPSFPTLKAQRLKLWLEFGIHRAYLLWLNYTKISHSGFIITSKKFCIFCKERSLWHKYVNFSICMSEISHLIDFQESWYEHHKPSSHFLISCSHLYEYWPTKHMRWWWHQYHFIYDPKMVCYFHYGNLLLPKNWPKTRYPNKTRT